MNFPNKLPLRWSTLLVVGFGLLLAMVGFFAEVFQAPPIPQEMAQLIKNPLPLHKLKNVRRLSFTNKAGAFKFENANSEGNPEGPWRMTEPTAIKARKDFFVKVLQALSDLQVRNVHRADSINLQSFSLDKPLFTLSIEPSEGAPIEIAFGLLNPIDNSTYFHMKDQEWIYQCMTLPLPLETVTADELLDARALAFTLDKVDQLEIDPNGLKLIRTGERWQMADGTPVDTRKVESFLKDLQALKSYMVLDKLTPSQSEALQQVMLTPQWRLKLGQAGTPEVYFISAAMDRLGDLKLDRSGSSLLYREGTASPIVLSREQVSIMNKRDKDFR